MFLFLIIIVAANCALDGADYANAYAITTNGNALNLGFVTTYNGNTNIGSRVYLLQDANTYQVCRY